MRTIDVWNRTQTKVLARPGIFRSIRKIGLICLLALLTLTMSTTAFANSLQGQVQSQNPLAVITASYTAVDAAMNAGNVVTHPAAARIIPQLLLSPAQAHVSTSVSGQKLYTYELSRVQVVRSWEAFHTHDFSANHVWSTFQTSSIVYKGTQAIVKGVETFHVDTTVQNNGTHPSMSKAKIAALALAKKTGHYIGDGQVNHGVALIQHTINLSKTATGWVIEQDRYWDVLEPGLASDHLTRTKEVQPTGQRVRSVPQVVHPALRTGYTYYRSAAIGYADYWWNSCNPSPNYTCYEDQGTDCANFVSQSIYDSTGGNLPGDDTWYSVEGYGTSVTFVNAPDLESYMEANFASVAVDDEGYAAAYQTDLYYEAPGDLIFYSWDGGPIIDHTAISVSADANSITQEDAHTLNVYHWYWDLEGLGANGYDMGATYWFVMIADSN